MPAQHPKDTIVTACVPAPVKAQCFNPKVQLPYGLTTESVQVAMEGFTNFLGFINHGLHREGLERLESMLMPANFSSIVGEFMTSTIPKHCAALVKNQYHNGHPDILPKGAYLNDAAQHVEQGIEVKGSRYLRSWQGHNPEKTWLLVFVFDSNRPVDESKGLPPIPFRFVKVVGAQLQIEDWTFSGRSETSRRTITASINDKGYAKMEANWLYRDQAAEAKTDAKAIDEAEPVSESNILTEDI